MQTEGIRRWNDT